MTEDDLIEECDGVVGAVYMVDVGLESGWFLITEFEYKLWQKLIIAYFQTN